MKYLVSEEDRILKLIVSEGNDYKFVYEEFDCRLHRHDHLLHWCGYIDIPTHCEIDSEVIRVHGGVTFDNHVDGVRRIGFDCAHSGDLSPYMFKSEYMFGFDGEYRDKEFVIEEIKSMGDQLKVMEEVRRSMLRKKREESLKKILK